MSEAEFKIKDRVKRDGQIGTIVRVFSRPMRTIGDVVLGPYPELYAVEWDNGEYGRAYLSHGLELIERREAR